MKTRWITIGVMKLAVFVQMSNSGTPGGLALDWVGGVNVFQPREFKVWADAWWAIRRRCAFAGLEAVSVAYGWSQGGSDKGLWVRFFGEAGRPLEVAVLVEVRRAVDRRWKRMLRRWKGHLSGEQGAGSEEQAEQQGAGTGEVGDGGGEYWDFDYAEKHFGRFE